MTCDCLTTLISEDPEFKYLAQKCFVSYFKSVWLQVCSHKKEGCLFVHFARVFVFQARKGFGVSNVTFHQGDKTVFDTSKLPADECVPSPTFFAYLFNLFPSVCLILRANL